jgi:hypothetical protein
MAISVRRVQGHARDNFVQGQQYLYRGVTHATPDIQTTAGKIVCIGVLPAYSLKQDTIVRVNTSFDGSMIIGTSTSSGTAAFGNTADLPVGDPGDTYVVDRGYGYRSTIDTPIYVQLTTGTTIGGADIWISYLKGDASGST